MSRKRVTSKVSEVKLTYITKQKACDRPLVNSSEKAYEIFQDNWSDQISLVEEFNILLLDRSNRVMSFANLFKGGISATVVDLKIVFATALKARASAIILAHNHPSGATEPSRQDIALTKKFKQAGEILDLKILDHIILSGEKSYYSFADNGLI